MTNLNPTEANPAATMGVTKVSIAVMGAAAGNPSQVADTEVRVATPKDTVEEINVFSSFTEFLARNTDIDVY